jgi:raffinose/stachyose/melibiose transport system permease protein
MDKVLRDIKAYFIFIIPTLLVYTFTVFLPIFWSAGYSLFNWNGIGNLTFIGFDNFIKLFTNDETFKITIINNVVYVAINLFVQLVGGLLFALLLFKLTRLREFIKVIYFTPVVISTMAMSCLFIRIFAINPYLGLLNYTFKMLGLDNLILPWLSMQNTALVCVSLVESYKYLALYMVIFYAALIMIPSDIVESAMLDGARGFSMLFKIKLPLIRNVVITGFVLCLNGTLKGFDFPFIMTRGGPGTLTELVATYMYKTAFLRMGYGYGSSIAVFLTVECLILTVFVRKIFSPKD